MNNIFLIITAILLATSACSSGQPAPVSLSAADDGKTIELKKGQTLQIALDGNPTTGYSWIPLAMEPALVEQVGEADYKPDSSLVGSPGMLTLKFKATSTGKGVLHLDYKRSWEKGVQPLKSFEVNLVVD